MAMAFCDSGILGKLERWNSEKLPRRFLDYSSDEESIYSEQGWETATIGQDLETESEEGHQSLNDVSQHQGWSFLIVYLQKKCL